MKIFLKLLSNTNHWDPPINPPFISPLLKKILKISKKKKFNHLIRNYNVVHHTNFFFFEKNENHQKKINHVFWVYHSYHALGGLKEENSVYRRKTVFSVKTPLFFTPSSHNFKSVPFQITSFSYSFLSLSCCLIGNN